MTASRSLTRLLSCTALVAIPALVPLALHADEPAAEAVELTPINVEGAAGDGTSPVAGEANPETLSGLKTAAPITEIPQSVTVVGREEMELENIQKLDGALAYVAGVQGQPYGYDSDTNWFFIRGFDATQTGVYQDGLPNFSYGFGGFYIDPVLVERVEVLKGPASVLYGGSNPGGIVNYVSRRAQFGDFSQVTLGADEFGGALMSFDVNRQISDALAGRVIGKIERTDGYGVFDAGWRGVINPTLAVETPDGTSIDLGLSYTKIDEQHVGGSWLPYYGTVEPVWFGRIDSEFNTSDPDYDYYYRDQLLLSSEISHEFDGGLRVTNVSRFGWSQVDESAPYAYGYGSGDAWNASWSNHFQTMPVNGTDTLSRIFFKHSTESLTALNDLRAEQTVATGPVEHNLLVGTDFKWFSMDQVQSSISSPDAPTISVLHPQHGGLGRITPVPYLDNTVDQTAFGVYAQDRMQFGDGWIVTLNGRYDWVQTTVEGFPAYDNSASEFSWRAGLGKTFDFGLTPYVSAATFFNPLIGASAAGELKPETGRQFEAGLKFAPEGMNLLVTLAGFHIERENVVTGPFNMETQLGQVRSQGVELEARGQIYEGLTLAAAATFMDVDVTRDDNAALKGKTPVATIEQQVAARLSWAVPMIPGLTLTGGVRWQGSSWADDVNTLKVPAVTLFDAGIMYDVTDTTQVNLVATNLTDETYVASCDGPASCYYGEGRRISLRLTQNF